MRRVLMLYTRLFAMGRSLSKLHPNKLPANLNCFSNNITCYKMYLNFHGDTLSLLFIFEELSSIHFGKTAKNVFSNVVSINISSA
jgi:hypothetical protein